jgi:hypothetical protein
MSTKWKCPNYNKSRKILHDRAAASFKAISSNFILRIFFLFLMLVTSYLNRAQVSIYQE